MITWCCFGGMKFYPIVRQCYILFINHILWLHVQSFIQAKQNPSCTAESPLCWDKILSCNYFNLPKHDEKVIHYMATKKNKKIVSKSKQIPDEKLPACQNEIWFSHISHTIVGWNLPQLDKVKFHSGKLGSCNHHLR